MNTYEQEMYEDFKLYFNATDDDVLSWRRTGRNEIVVHLRNGEVACYDHLGKTFGFLERYETDERGNYIMDDNEYRLAFGKKLRRLMRNALMTQQQLSEASGISVVSLSHYMNGRAMPDLRNAGRLSRALDCSIEELLNFE